MPDKNGYPTKNELNILKKWDIEKNSIIEFLDYLESIWWNAEYGFELNGKKILKLELHTLGWSGNEEIISILNGTMFWRLYWQKSSRGGHYYFSIKPIK